MESSSVDRGQDLSEKELVMHIAGRRLEQCVPGRERPRPRCYFLRWKHQSLLCWRKCPKGRCVDWQPVRVIFSENSLTYQRRVVGGQALCKWSEVCGHWFKMKLLNQLRFSRALVLGSVWSVSITGKYDMGETWREESSVVEEIMVLGLCWLRECRNWNNGCRQGHSIRLLVKL